jgi:hypothetical protein
MAGISKNEKPSENQSTSSDSYAKSSLDSAQKPGSPKEEVLFTWKAVSRPFQKRGREYWITVVSIASLLAFILFLAEGVMPVILISSLIFLYYILSTVKPEDIEYGLTSRGLRVADVITTWNNLTQFWFTKRMGSDLLVVETTTFPFRLELVIDQEDILRVKRILADYIPEGKTSPTYLDKVADWVSKKLPRS